ncbi:Phenazine biosynthesis PhzC/PhzF protein [Nostocoides australiense Ben110]|uniref:Phenazine biosynthesis PhzC/PhzF protein n=1 Tax=Nostocoides australiense Ben110 TaxID=1193182 RepID=W6JYY6_9MICO|nr:PhzF family phenazine biosynthesis protein [Tetrasphaera australiensis]CCH73931.1 Phenazine biosynthesis PhzC/PhzF protein [Tetrasphaera australiensis Ben110]
MPAFRQIDVFTAVPLRGNPLAVVHDADDWSDEQMAQFANWTNLSETTFLQQPTDPRADYRVRIFTIAGELPFAGHPTIGSAHAWREAGGIPKAEGRIVQECGVGLVDVSYAERLAFAAPPLLRSGPVELDHVATIGAALGLTPDQILAAAWIDNGPGWIGLEIDCAASVLALDPDPARMRGLKVGVLGRHADSGPVAVDVKGVDVKGVDVEGVEVEVRAFYSDGRDAGEDPVTGSLNAGMAQWLIGESRLPERYVARQGTALGRDGRVHVHTTDDRIWVGGDAVTVLTGSVAV